MKHHTWNVCVLTESLVIVKNAMEGVREEWWIIIVEGRWIKNYILLLVSCLVLSDSLQPHGLQHARLPYPSLSPRICSNSCPLSWWCHPTASFSVLFSPALNLSQHQGLFQWVSSSYQVAKVLELQHPIFPVNNHHWFPLRLTGLISLLYEGLSRVYFFCFSIFILLHTLICCFLSFIYKMDFKTLDFSFF